MWINHFHNYCQSKDIIQPRFHGNIWSKIAAGVGVLYECAQRRGILLSDSPSRYECYFYENEPVDTSVFTKNHLPSKGYLESSQKSVMELFCENV